MRAGGSHKAQVISQGCVVGGVPAGKSGKRQQWLPLGVEPALEDDRSQFGLLLHGLIELLLLGAPHSPERGEANKQQKSSYKKIER
jgi:hypothetical protein